MKKSKVSARTTAYWQSDAWALWFDESSPDVELIRSPAACSTAASVPWCGSVDGRAVCRARPSPGEGFQSVRLAVITSIAGIPMQGKDQSPVKHKPEIRRMLVQLLVQCKNWEISLFCKSLIFNYSKSDLLQFPSDFFLGFGELIVAKTDRGITYSIDIQSFATVFYAWIGLPMLVNLLVTFQTKRGHTSCNPLIIRLLRLDLNQWPSD